MNLFTKQFETNIRGFFDFGKQAEPKNPCLRGTRTLLGVLYQAWRSRDPV